MFENIRNNIDFFIRNNFRFSRKNFCEKSQSALERNVLENLYTKDILTQCLEFSNKKSLKILDIGCKNWFYAKGENDYFSSFCDNISFDGVEIDAYRLYSNFYSRYETAKYYTRDLKNFNYIADNLLNINEKYDYIIWFLPFVFKEPHQMWGLPDRLFYPEKLLKHALNLLADDGQMLIVNQGKVEAAEQKRMLDLLGINYKEQGKLKSEYFEYQNDRYAFVINKSHA